MPGDSAVPPPAPSPVSEDLVKDLKKVVVIDEASDGMPEGSSAKDGVFSWTDADRRGEATLVGTREDWVARLAYC